MPVAPAKPRTAPIPPRVLIVDDEPDVIELVQDMLGKRTRCQITSAGSIAQAKKILNSEHIDLLIVDLGLPDGDGAELMQTLHDVHPTASAVVITGAPSFEGAVAAMRHGAVDFLPKPFTASEFLNRIDQALARRALHVKRELRIDKLRDAVRRLNQARRLVTRKVDLLCNDLVSAYGDLSRQLDLVRVGESFRASILSANDLEQMLCHAMDWILRQLGYSNVAIWLAGDDGYQLGAYMKYTIAGDEPLTSAMCNGFLRLIEQQGVVRLSASESQKQLTAEELKYLKKQTLMGSKCTYLGEPLAQMVVFRDGDKPFSDDDLATLKIITPIFGLALATVSKNDDLNLSSDDSDDEYDTLAGGFEENTDQPPRKRRKDDDADWWKRGETPPF
jgi:FixJ family two-component response regulator